MSAAACAECLSQVVREDKATFFFFDCNSHPAVIQQKYSPNAPCETWIRSSDL